MLNRFRPREEGQGLVEYALILVLIAVVVIIILLQLGPQIGQVFSQVTNILQKGGAAGSQSATIEAFSVSGASGMGCAVTLTNLRVKITQLGQPVNGASVQATVSLQASGSQSLNGTTNSSGIVQWSGGSLGIDPNPCGGRSATVSVNGATAMAGY